MPIWLRHVWHQKKSGSELLLSFHNVSRYSINSRWPLLLMIEDEYSYVGNIKNSFLPDFLSGWLTGKMGGNVLELDTWGWDHEEVAVIGNEEV